jgi:hypothetical protein
MFLPANYHSVAGFEAALDSITLFGPGEANVHPTLVLALGMMLAEFNRTQFADPDEEASLLRPQHVVDTPLVLVHSETLTNVVKGIW